MLKIKAVFTPKASLAQQQNEIPLLNELSLENTSRSVLEDIELCLSCDPPFHQTKVWHLDRIAGGGQFSVSDLNVVLSRAYLADLKEAVRAMVILTARQGENELARSETPIDVLCPNHWGGLGHLPELMAAFCRPNDPAVDTILKRASDLLRASGKSPALEGYQRGDRNRVWYLISAIYNAAASLGIDYANPPASFESQGQKIRSPSNILESGLGTCLDLTLLLTACFEQCGLNPLVLVKTGHAFCGCWLHDEDFSIATIDDPHSIQKRVKLGEMVLVESTLLTCQPTPPLKSAAKEADYRLEAEDEFIYAIDIKRARMQSIRPLMDKEIGIGPSDDQNTSSEPPPLLEIEEAPDLPEIDFLNTREERPKTPEGRIQRWKRSLLDLTLRNKLLNFRPTAKSIPVFCPDPARLEDLLADGHTLKFVPLPEEMDGTRDSEIFRTRQLADAKEIYAREVLEKKELLVDLAAKELEDRLVALYRKARNDIQEGGASTLFLAIGFLLWTRRDLPRKKFKAPLLLLPVSIERKSVRSGFRLLLHDDDPRLNPTLLQLLRQDYGLNLDELEEELPRDNSGLDVPLIWQMVRKQIRDIEGWDVNEEVCISTFSFTKYLMWKDLEERTDQLRESPIVRHLIESPREPYRDQGDFPKVGELDDEHTASQTFCPLPADSSQLAAVFAAADGKDFVLVGPPGTGKSQTITNTIVQCLAMSKQVLFVSEKMAALEVVYRRLRDVGLGKCILELHSSKARKLNVLQQLGAAWDAAGSGFVGNREKLAKRLSKHRAELNAYPRQLHRVYRNGLTPYQALGTVIANRETANITLPWSGPEIHDEDQLERFREQVKRLSIHAAEVGDLAQNTFATIRGEQWSPKWQHGFVAATRALIDNSKPLLVALAAFGEALDLSFPTQTKAGLIDTVELAALLPEAAGKAYAVFFSGEGSAICEHLEEVIGHRTSFSKLQATLSQEYLPEATSLDHKRLANQWTKAGQAWWAKSFWLRGQVRKQLATVSYSLPDDARVPGDLETLGAMQTEERAVAQLEQTANPLARLWQGMHTDLSAVSAAVIFGRRAIDLVGRCSTGDLAMLLSLRTNLGRLVQDGNDLLRQDAPLALKSKAVGEAMVAFELSLAELNALASSDEDPCPPAGSDESWLEHLASSASAWLEHLPKLRAWCGWCRVRRQAVDMDLTSLVEALERGAFETAEVTAVFEVNYQRWWLDAATEEDPLLRDFVSAEHQKRIETFRDLDARITGLNGAFVFSGISDNLPTRATMAKKAGTQWGVLHRQLNLRRRHKPLRKLIGEIPDVIAKLTPCLLMSPLSIAQFLSPDSAPFDVVIFDEASQIPVWDAIGAIARGKQAIVVGDPKQLPPTSFFSRADNADDTDFEDLEVEETESILDECQSALIPTLQLNWHYRSRHESLIAFSNFSYYDGKMVTFPSSATADRAVAYFHIAEGVYERGKARVNREEAKRIVRETLTWLRDPEFNQKGWTLGIVTFNIQQQVLIEDLMDEQRHQHPELEKHFSEEAIEPVFVKNLENVQGDERDIILFSLTFGPDKMGKISMNFGPLNGDGGERRLNVAITRARRLLHLYGTLKADDIDLSRTKARGVHDLKRFLYFAENGACAWTQAQGFSPLEAKDDFVGHVARVLGEKGWVIQERVGVSGYRIDLGVVHPDDPNRFLAGVECDGATYRDSATARDRDCLRHQVLEGLGWQMKRLWSIDWWIDPDDSLLKLHHYLTELMDTDLPANETGNHRVPPVPVRKQKPTGVADHKEQTYKVADPLSVVAAVKKADFFLETEIPNLQAMIRQIVQMEGPLPLVTLIWRIRTVYGYKATNPKIAEYLHHLASDLFSTTQEDDQIFLWPEGINEKNYDQYRLAMPGEPRKVEHLCGKELTNLAQAVRNLECPLNDHELMRGMAERLGYGRLSQSLSEQLVRGIPSS